MVASDEPEEGETILGILENGSVLPAVFNHEPAIGAHGADRALAIGHRHWPSTPERASIPHGVPELQDFWSAAPNGELGMVISPAVQGRRG